MKAINVSVGFRHRRMPEVWMVSCMMMFSHENPFLLT